MPTDDLTGGYLKQRDSVQLTPAQRFRMSQTPQPAVTDQGAEKFEFSPGNIIADIGRGIVESPRQIVGGFMDATKEASEAAESLMSYIAEPRILQLTNEKGEFDPDIVLKSEFTAKGGETLAEAMTPSEAQSTTGGLIRGVSQFLTGFLPATRALKGVKAVSTIGTIAKAAAAGAAADAIVFDPHEERLSNLVEKYPALQNPVTEYLAASPDDSEAEGRFKNVIEGLGLGALTEGFLYAVKGIRANRRAKITDKAAADEAAKIEKLAAVETEDIITGLRDAEGNIIPEEYIFTGENLPKDTAIAFELDDGTIIIDRNEKTHIRSLEKLNLDPDKVVSGGFVTSEGRYKAHSADTGKFIDAERAKKRVEEILKKDKEQSREVEAKAEPEFKQFDATEEPAFKVGSKQAGKERALNINTDRLNTEDDVKNLIEGVADKFSKDINEARREVITYEETEKLADELGMTVDGLLSRRKGQAFNAEQAVAARKILVASGENLINLAKAAKAGSEIDVIKFRKAMSRHHAIQSQVSGLTAEAGRALSSFNIVARSAKEQERLIKEALEAGGGAENSRNLAGQLAQLEGPHQINTFVKQAAGAKTKAMVYEAWINGLLSNPATHTVNMLSNSIVAGWSVGERKVASMIGAGLDFQNIPEGEATAQLFGMVQGAKDGMRLAWKALKTGEPADVITKIESQGHKAITAENLNLSGTAGRFADFVGEAIRVPGRFLTAGDELFKSIGYRMELHAQAFRQATGEGLQGNDLAKRITDIIENPPENLDLAAIDASRYQTFTKPLEEGGQALQNFIQKTPGAKLIVPFIRTPVNIMKYAGERTILAPLSKRVREEIAAGGARRDLALAKIATGSMVMAAAADYTLTGQLTGGGPKNPQMKARLRETGWQPYSVKIGDTYYSYSRLDPAGALLGLAADISEIIGQTEDADALDLATSAVVAAAQNITSKTYLSGVAEFFDVMSSVSADPEDNNKRAKQWIERFAGSVVPSGVAGLERVISPELEATQGVLEKIQSRIPGYSADLPPRRNIFGEPIVLSGGLGPDIMSPIYTSEYKKDPVADEIVKQKTLLRMPRNVIYGVELTTEQYDKYIKFYSGENNRFVKNPLKIELQELFRKPIYQNATDGQEGGKSTLIRAVFENYRNAAKQSLLEEDTRLFLDVQQLKREKLMKLGAK